MYQANVECPFCGYEDNEYAVLMHMEYHHAESDSPYLTEQNSDFVGTIFTAADSGFEADQVIYEYSDCPVDGCGESIRVDEMAYHIELHAQEERQDDGSETSEATPNQGPSITLNGQNGPKLVPSAEAPISPALPRDTDQQERSNHSRRDGRDDSSRSYRRVEEGGGSNSTSIEKRAKSRSSQRQSSLLQWMGLVPRPSAASGAKQGRGKALAEISTGNSSSTVMSEQLVRGVDVDSPSPSPLPPILGAASADVNSHQKKRLGKAELGKYAHEQTMPAWLVSHLRKGGEVKAEGVLPVLEQLLEQSQSTKYAFLCHQQVQHISKLKKEGGFCGYRNIQMMVSYINSVKFTGHQHFDGQLPSIFRIQDLIENAWDKGINAQGRIETGGVKGTRKYIGTPEAQAVFCSLGIPCEAQGFKNREPGKSEARLMQEVERYFQSGDFDPEYKVRRTSLPPIYFQHAGHSMTIVGFEKLKGGQTNLLVFDPMFRDSSAILKLVGRQFEYKFPDLALKPYRRGNKYLKKYREFEILRLRKPQQQ